MKYPNDQYQIVIKSLKILAKHLDIKSVYSSHLHYVIYQQFAQGQEHNSFYIHENKVIRKGFLSTTQLLNATKLIDFEATFELYPNDTNDNHIETAMKKALKEF